MPTLSSRIVWSVSGDKCGLAPITRFGRRRITRFGTNLQRRGAVRRDRPGYVVLPDALGALANPGTKGTIGMNTRPNIIARELPAVPAVRGNER
jgi:hypothetical protein